MIFKRILVLGEHTLVEFEFSDRPGFTHRIEMKEFLSFITTFEKNLRIFQAEYRVEPQG
jgi:hypothetical protein